MLTNDTRTAALSYTNTSGLITLRNGTVTVRLTDLGCAVLSIHTPDRNGIRKNIVAGFSTPAEYSHNPWYFGCIVGRYANRIAGGRFTLDGRTVQLSRNNEGNHLHGGFEGFHKKTWDITRVINQPTEVGVVFSYTSQDGEEGYPGTIKAEVQYTLTIDNRLKMEYRAETDKKTPVNLTNHSYFNLSGFETPRITDHILRINARHYTEKGADNLPTGHFILLPGSPLDFSSPTAIGRNIDSFPIDKGFDHNFVLSPYLTGETTPDDQPAAELTHPGSGRVLRLWTDQPGLQLYTANWWDGLLKGAHDQPYVQHGAVALETQAFPDSPNHPEFPNTILDPGDTYCATTILEFDVRD